MTRKKVKLVWIANDTARKASLKKRRAGLTKKVSELTTLCDVKAFVIIYNPDEAEPTLWPNRREVEELVARYQSIPEMKRGKKRMNQERYLMEQMGKIQELTKKNSKKNRDCEMSFLMNKLHNREWDYNVLELAEVQSLVWLVEERIRDTRKKDEYFQQTPPLIPSAFLSQREEQSAAQVGAEVAPPPPPPPSFEERVQQGIGEFRANPTDSMMWDQWFLKMVRNSDNVAGGSGSSARAPRTPPPSPPPPFMPQEFNFGGFATGGGYVGDLSLGLPLSRGNPFEFAMTPHDQNPFGIGLSPGDFGGSSSNANHLGLGPTQPRSTCDVGASNTIDEGLSGTFASGSDVAGLPWPPNFSP